MYSSIARFLFQVHIYDALIYPYQQAITSSHAPLKKIWEWHGDEASFHYRFIVTLHSTKPQPKEKEYIVQFIAKNRWRIPGSGGHVTLSEDGGGTEPGGRSEEELQLEREAAEAVLRGTYILIMKGISWGWDGDISYKSMKYAYSAYTNTQ